MEYKMFNTTYSFIVCKCNYLLRSFCEWSLKTDIVPLSSSGRVIVIVSILIFSIFSDGFAQNPFYIQNANNIVKVENQDAAEIKASEWQIRLYKKGVTKQGGGYWGIITGTTASQVLIKLKKCQEFELRYNEFMHDARMQNELYTHFNELGPIAIIEKIGNDRRQQNDAAEKYIQNTEKALLAFSTWQELHEHTSGFDEINQVLNPAEASPYNGLGNIFKEYTDNIKSSFVNISELQKVLMGNSEKVNKCLSLINKDFNSANANATKIRNVIGTRSDAIDIQLKESLESGRKLKQEVAGSNEKFYAYVSIMLGVEGDGYYPNGIKKSKRLYIFSGPIQYSGDIEDSEKVMKEKFLTNIMENQPEYSNLGSEDIVFHTCSTVGTGAQNRILTIEECAQAIENTKSMVKKGWGGYNDAFEIIQLK